MTKDANQIAQEHTRRVTGSHQVTVEPSGVPPQVWGRFRIWTSIGDMMDGRPPIMHTGRATLDLTKPGLVIVYSPDNSAEILSLREGWYMLFEPGSDEG